MTLPLFIRYFFIACLALSAGCAPATKKVKGTADLKSVSKDGNSLYYYLVSSLQAGAADKSLFYLDQAIKRDPGSPYLLTSKAYSLARQNRLDEAADLARKAYLQDPEDVDTNILIGKIQSTRLHHAEAIDHFNRAIKKDSKNEIAYNLLAQEYLAIKKPTEAIAAIKKLIDINPGSAAAYFVLGSIYAMQLKDYDKALDAFDEVLDIDPDNARVMDLEVEILLSQKKPERALEVLRKMSDLNPTDLGIRTRMAVLYFENKKIDEAIRVFEEIKDKSPDKDKIHYYLGLLNEERKDWDKATSYYDLVSPKSELFLEAAVRKVILLKNQNRWEEAFAFVRNLVDEYPTKVQYYDLLSNLYEQKKDLNAAFDVIQKGLKKNPHSEELLLNLGVLYEKKGDREKAISTMQQVLKVNDKNTTALNFIGYSFAEKGENLEEAFNLVLRAHELKPGDGFILDSLGWIYFLKGDAPKAIEYLERAAKLVPKEATIYEHLGDIYVSQGNKRAARQNYEKCVTLIREIADLGNSEKEQIQRVVGKLGKL